MLLLQTFKNRSITGLAFSPDGTRLAVAPGTDDPVELWDATAGKRIRSEPTASAYSLGQHVRFDPTGKWLFIAGGQSGFHIVDVETGQRTRLERFEFPIGMAVSPTGNRIVIHDHYARTLKGFALPLSGDDKSLWINKYDSGSGGRWLIGGLAFYPDGKRFATVEYRNMGHKGIETILSVRDAGHGRMIDKTYCACESASHLSISPDGVWTAFAASTHLLAYHATEAGDSGKFPSTNRKHLTGIAFHPGGRFLAATSNDATVRFHDIARGWEVTKTFDWNIGKLKSITFSADGTLAATGGEKGQVVLWDVDL